MFKNNTDIFSIINGIYIAIINDIYIMIQQL